MIARTGCILSNKPPLDGCINEGGFFIALFLSGGGPSPSSAISDIYCNNN